MADSAGVQVFMLSLPLYSALPAVTKLFIQLSCLAKTLDATKYSKTVDSYKAKNTRCHKVRQTVDSHQARDRVCWFAGFHIVHASVQHATSSGRVLCRARLDSGLQSHLRCRRGMVLSVLCAIHDLRGVFCVLDAQRPS